MRARSISLDTATFFLPKQNNNAEASLVSGSLGRLNNAMRRFIPRLLPSLGLLALAYVVTFAINAIYGGYLLMPSGNYRPIANLAQANTWVWQPGYGTFHLFRTASGPKGVIADIPGYIYSPLILLLQNLLKPSALAYSEGMPFYRPPLEQIHPTYRMIFSE